MRLVLRSEIDANSWAQTARLSAVIARFSPWKLPPLITSKLPLPSTKISGLSVAELKLAKQLQRLVVKCFKLLK